MFSLLVQLFRDKIALSLARSENPASKTHFLKHDSIPTISWNDAVNIKARAVKTYNFEDDNLKDLFGNHSRDSNNV